MVSPCANNGPAQPIPGSGQNVVMTSAAVESTLVLLGLEPVAAVLAPILAGVTFDLTTLCGNDPPADPGLTGADVIAATNFLDPLNAQAAIQKVYQWFKHFYWYYACECVSGATPAVPTPSNPGNPVSTNTGLPYASQASQCWDAQRQVSFAAGPGNTDPPQNISDYVLPQTQRVTTTEPYSGSDKHGYVMPQGITSVTLTMNAPTPITFSSVQCFIDFFDASGTNLGALHDLIKVHGDNTTVFTTTFTPPVGAYAWIAAAESADSAAQVFTVEVSYLCTGGTSIFQQSCCPPDPTLSAQMTQVLQLVQAIYAGLPVTPTSYAESTVHSGLTGNGSVTLGAGVLAVRVDVTSDQPTLGVDQGSPLYLFDRGYIVPIAAEGPIRAEARLVYNPQLFPLPTLTERIGYSLHAGIVASITELKAGP